MNEFKIDITVKQFLNKFFLTSFDWFYCYVDFPEEVEGFHNAKWECSEVIRPKSNRDRLNDFLNFWGNMEVFKAQIIKPGDGTYPTGENLEGIGMIIYVKYNEEMFK